MQVGSVSRLYRQPVSHPVTMLPISLVLSPPAYIIMLRRRMHGRDGEFKAGEGYVQSSLGSGERGGLKRRNWQDLYVRDAFFIALLGLR